MIFWGGEKRGFSYKTVQKIVSPKQMHVLATSDAALVFVLLCGIFAISPFRKMRSGCANFYLTAQFIFNKD